MKKVFFIGINGIGMSGLAKIMKNKGYDVYGSDISKKDVTEDMEKMGIKIYFNHEEENMIGMDMAVYSTAIKDQNPEYKYAKKNNIKMIKRGELLAELMNEKTGIAIAGTHGKTTTSSMMGIVALEQDATIVVGGIIPEINNNSKIGNGDYFIAEADESDNSFLYMKPEYAIITNVEEDHMDYHENYDNLKKSFREFIIRTKNKVIVNKDCPELYKIASEYKKVIFYSLYDKSADIYVDNIKKDEYLRNVYTVIKNNKNLGEFILGIPGNHNISNSLGVIYLADELGIDLNYVKEKLINFKGAKRRFDILYENRITIIDDYAHHPTEIKATLQAAKEKSKKRIIAVFQPHRYSRVSHLMNEFCCAFEDADRVIFLPIYSAGEENSYGVSSDAIAKKIKEKKEVCIVDEENQLKNLILKDSNEGDMYIFMGAGNISQMAYRIKDEYKKLSSI